ncbi:MAG: phage major capsid protein [Rhodopirellula sp.]|nr:phage major capsid protein [Rhodopirellula sp.]
MTTSEMANALEEVNKGFEELKKSVGAEADKRVQAAVDVLEKEKIEKINESINAMMDSINAHNDEMKANAEKLAQFELGEQGDADKLSPQERKYEAAFDKFFRTGKNEDQISSMIEEGGIKAALSVGSDEDGGYTVPVEWDRTITDKLKQISAMRNFATVTNVSGRGFTRLFNIRGTASGWVGETAARPETDGPTLQPYTYAFGEIYAMPGITQRLLDDSEIDIDGWLASEVGTEFDFQEGEAFVNGDGDNKPRGLLTYTEADELALGASLRHPLGHIKEVTSGAAADLTPDGLVDLIYDVESTRATNASLYMNRRTQGIVRKMKDGDGNFLWQPPFQAGEPATLLGVSQRELVGMPDVAADAIPVFYGDMGMVYNIFDRFGVRVLRDPFTNKPYIMFYTTKRVGGGLWNPEYGRYHRVSAA